jgi:hypothetical protein
MVALGINIFFCTQYQAKVAIVANQAAKVVAARKYWLGMLRPDYDADAEKATQDKATEVAKNCCKILALPAPTSVSFNDTMADEGDYNQVTVTVSSLPLPFSLGNVFPNVTSVTCTGVDFQPKQQQYAMLNIACVHPKLDPSAVYGPGATKANMGATDVVSLPAFGFQYTEGTTAGAPNPPFAQMGGPDGSGTLRPKYFRGLPLTNKFLNSRGLPGLPAPLEFDPSVVIDDGVNPPVGTSYYGESGQTQP